jgi:hypothetical protein
MKTLGLLRPPEPDVEPNKYPLIGHAEDVIQQPISLLTALTNNVIAVTNMDISLPIALTKPLSETFVKPVLNQVIFIDTALRTNVISVINITISVLIALLPLLN